MLLAIQFGAFSLCDALCVRSGNCHTAKLLPLEGHFGEFASNQLTQVFTVYAPVSGPILYVRNTCLLSHSGRTVPHFGLEILATHSVRSGYCNFRNTIHLSGCNHFEWRMLLLLKSSVTQMYTSVVVFHPTAQHIDIGNARIPSVQSPHCESESNKIHVQHILSIYAIRINAVYHT